MRSSVLRHQPSYKIMGMQGISESGQLVRNTGQRDQYWMIAISGAYVLGPRIGKFRKDGTARAFPGHNILMAIIGTIILFFCWFDFNAGSTLSASEGIFSLHYTVLGGLVRMTNGLKE